jgi:hypothetical protein
LPVTARLGERRPLHPQAHPGGSVVSELDRLSPRALHALQVSCAQSNVPVQLADPATIERIIALLRTTGTAAPARAAGQPQTQPIRLEHRRGHHNSSRGQFLPETTSASEWTSQRQTTPKRPSPFLDSAAQQAARVEQSKRPGPYPPHADEENSSDIYLTG